MQASWKQVSEADPCGIWPEAYCSSGMDKFYLYCVCPTRPVDISEPGGNEFKPGQKVSVYLSNSLFRHISIDQIFVVGNVLVIDYAWKKSLVVDMALKIMDGDCLDGWSLDKID